MSFSVALGVVTSVVLDVAAVVVFGFVLGVLFGVAAGMMIVGFDDQWVGMLDVPDRMSDVGPFMVFGVSYGVTLGVLHGMKYGGSSGMVRDVLYGVGHGVVGGIMGYNKGGVLGGMALGVASCATFELVYFRLIVYPFDWLLAALAAWMGSRSPQAARRAWTWHPVHWNEVIWLPLPFTAGLLVRLARQDRTYGFEQIAFVAAERSLQRHAAVKALEQIALDDLRADTLEVLAEAGEKLVWTMDAPAALPEAIAGFVPDFERIARLAGQSLALDNLYRRNERVKQAREELETLQKRLIVLGGRDAARLLQTANQWRRLLEAESERLAQQTIRRELPNPFIYGNPINEDRFGVFAGRLDVVRAIEAAVLNVTEAPTLLLHGARRMGKSSILKQLPRLLGPDFAPALVDCQQPGARESLPGLLRYLSAALAEGLRRRRVEVKPLTTEDLAAAPFQRFDAWLQTMESAMPQNLRALLCLDEYERLQSALDAGWGADFLDQLRHILQHIARALSSCSPVRAPLPNWARPGPTVSLAHGDCG